MANPYLYRAGPNHCYFNGRVFSSWVIYLGGGVPGASALLMKHSSGAEGSAAVTMRAIRMFSACDLSFSLALSLAR